MTISVIIDRSSKVLPGKRVGGHNQIRQRVNQPGKAGWSQVRIDLETPGRIDFPVRCRIRNRTAKGRIYRTPRRGAVSQDVAIVVPVLERLVGDQALQRDGHALVRKRLGEGLRGGFAVDVFYVAQLMGRKVACRKLGGGDVHKEAEAIEHGVTGKEEAEQQPLLLIALVGGRCVSELLDELGELIRVVCAGPQAIPDAVMAAWRDAPMSVTGRAFCRRCGF
jgi:hypothetical protein